MTEQVQFIHLSMKCRQWSRQGKGWGFDFLQKFAIKFPAHWQIIPVKRNQISLPQAAHCCQSQGRIQEKHNKNISK